MDLMNAQAQSQQRPHSVLDVRLSAGSDERYAVSFALAGGAGPHEPDHSIDLACFRFTLHYYARVLYELVRHEKSVRNLPRMMGRISATAIDPASNLFEIAGVRAVLAPVVADRISAVLSLRPCGLRVYEIDGDLSRLRGSKLATSAVAVCQAALRHLSPANIEALPVALANMNASYEMTHRFGDPNSQYEVPGNAYYATAFV
ncbi:MAG TPA: hypothetical protein VNA69_07965 [Thermoanaerobaculia bacterium]|nr:hypothetical protein [Thermoanaerobaculia bacterium]